MRRVDMRKKATSLRWLVFAVAGLLPNIVQAASTSDWNTLLERMAERNAIGDEVALSKWDTGKPVLDAVREAAVLEAVKGKAASHGLDPGDAAKIFAGLIESNKLVQYELLSEWRVRGVAPDGKRPELAALRVHLDQLEGELLQSFSQTAALRARKDCPVSLAHAVGDFTQSHSLDAIHKMALVRSVGDLCK